VIQMKKQPKKNIYLTVEELRLICRALSDSMNYKPDDRIEQKWNLLLKCTVYKLNIEKLK